MKADVIVVHSLFRHTIDELTLYFYKTDALTARILLMPEDWHSPVIGALRTALETLGRCDDRPLSTV